MPGHGGRRTTQKLQGLGKAIESDRKRRSEMEANPKVINKTGVAEGKAGRSILEQSSLDDFLAAADLGNETFEAEKQNWRTQNTYEGPTLVATQRPTNASNPLEVSVPVPRRPQWDEDMDGEELASLEGEAFLRWRRGLAQVEERNGLIMTPYEKNLDFWRQLWRTCERSDLLCQIIDARDPNFYRSRDLECMVKEQGKRHLLLLNKADYLSEEMRQRWAAYFAGIGTEVIFFSALRELHRQQRLPDPSVDQSQEANKSSEVDAAAPKLLPHGDLSRDDADVLNVTRLMDELRARLPAASEDGTIGTVGFVGYPNVGKSSVINAIFGAKKVSMGRVPGKTKHLQTLELSQGITLCDCPGLVFPSVVATKSHLIINGTIPIEELRDFAPHIRLIMKKMGGVDEEMGGMLKAMKNYGVTDADLKEGIELREDEISVAEDPARALLSGLATARKKFLRGKNPDETWAARKVLLDFFTGALLHCESPPDASVRAPVAAVTPVAPLMNKYSGYGSAPSAEAPKAQAPADDDDDSDFDDLGDFLNGGSDDRRPKKKNTGTKKQQRMQQARGT